jgi:hypothetical protein
MVINWFDVKCANKEGKAKYCPYVSCYNYSLVVLYDEKKELFNGIRIE